MAPGASTATFWRRLGAPGHVVSLGQWRCYAAYVVLAEALDCPLVTRDARLARSSGHAVQIEVR